MIKQGEKVIVRCPESVVNGQRGEVTAVTADGKHVYVVLTSVFAFKLRDLERVKDD